MTPPHIALAAANISLDASRRIVDLLASRPVDAALIAEAAQIAHEADVKVRALLPGPHLHGVATAQPDVGVLHDLRRRLLAEDIDALVVVDEDAGGDAVTRVLDTYFTEGAVPARPLQRRVYPRGSTVRVVTARDLDAHPDMIAASILDVAVVLAPISAAALDEVRARLLRNCGTLIGFGAPVPSIRTPAESFADAGPTLSVPIRAEDVTITASPTYPDPTGWIRALRGPTPSTAPTDRRLQALARLVDVAGAAVGLEDFVASTRAEYPDVFADLDEHLRQVAQGVFTIEDFEDAVRALESNAITPPAVVAGPNVARLAGALDALAPGWSVDEPPDPSLWAQTLDRAQVAALAGERPSLVVQTEPREARWLRDLVEEDDSAELARLRKIERCAQGVFPRMEAVRRGGPIADVNQAQSELHWHLRDLCDLVKSETAPPSEAERIAAHVAAVAPGYRERARAWLDAEHADMVEDLAALMATVSAECCS